MKCAYISISTRSAAHRHLRGQGVRFFAPDVAFDDAEKYLPPLLKKRGKFDADLSASLEYLRNIIEVVTPELYAVFESEARQRLRGRDESDWPILATALGLATCHAKDRFVPYPFGLSYRNTI